MVSGVNPSEGMGPLPSQSHQTPNYALLEQYIQEYMANPNPDTYQNLVLEIDKLEKSPNISSQDLQELHQLSDAVVQYQTCLEQIPLIDEQLQNPNLSPYQRAELTGELANLAEKEGQSEGQIATAASYFTKSSG